MNINEALKLAGDYADSLTTADDITNRNTMEVAAALDAAYESKEWVRGVVPISVAELLRVAELLNVSAADLLRDAA